MFVISQPLKTWSQCFEIESVLVDACGNPEGENEMVRFSVGGTALNVNDLSVNWATTANPWLGICQGANTANITNQLNATITTCGFLKEPIGGVLPANSHVLLITSTDIDVSFNSFDGLNDTLYLIFQCAGNTAGHFGNYNSSGGTRTLTMNFSNPGGCSDVVSYERDLLINQNGIPGGNSSLKDGGTVNYTANGTATYTNSGCQAPIIVDSIEITTTSPISICPTDTVSLTAVSSNNNTFWLGGNGTFSTPTNLSTDYYSSASDVFPLMLYVGYAIPCGDTILDSIQINQSSANSVNVTASSSSLCDGEIITLTASGTGTFEWFDGTTNNTTTVDTAGVFFATTSSSTCGVDTARVTILWNGEAPSVTLSGNNSICQGESTLITASGDAPFTWNNGSVGTTYTSTSAETIYASVSNTCGVDTAYMTISISGTPPVATTTGALNYCDNIPTTLTASGGDSYTWSDGSTGTTYSSLAGTGYVVVSNSCGTDTAHFTIVDLGNSPNVILSGNNSICQGESAVITASGDAPFTWNNGSVGSTYTSTSAETIYASVSNACGVDTAYMTISISGIPPTAQVLGDLFICDNLATTLTASGGDSYIWNDGSVNNSYTSLTGNGYLVANNDCGTDTAYFSIVDFGNSPIASIVGDSNICSNVESYFYANGGNSYLWNTGASENFIATNIANDIYVIAYNQCGEDTAFLALIDQSVEAAFEMNDSVGYAPLEITFTNYSVNSSNYIWDLGNGETSTNEDEEQTYTEGDSYIVELIASNDYCYDTTTHIVQIQNSSSVYIPNSFSPNNDNINDFFTPVVSSISDEDYSLYIFDRNGGIVFYSTVLGASWDGTKNGILLPSDTYIWKIQYKVIGKLENHEKIGHINLIR